MSKIETGGPAFPVQTSITSDGSTLTVKGSSGLTLRDYFAAKAMQALLTKQGPYGEDRLRPYSENVQNVDELAEYAYTQADAMLEARK